MFNVSTCAKCGNGTFKLVTQEPQGSSVKLNFIQCASCNVPIGAMDFYATGSQLVKVKGQIEDLASDVRGLKQTLEKLARDLRG